MEFFIVILRFEKIMLGKIIKAGFLASIAGMITFYIFADLLGNQMILKESYILSSEIWRNSNILTKNIFRILKYFSAFILTNALWSYVYYKRQNSFASGTGVQKGIKFFFFFWLLTIPLHFWFWVMIYYPVEILIYNVFVTHLIMFTVEGMIIGKICTEEKVS